MFLMGRGRSRGRRRRARGRAWAWARMNGKAASGFHSIRNRPTTSNENNIIIIWLESQGDPFVRTKLAEWCANQAHLQYIDEHYLDRIAKLKVFI
jgi:hypothetical protein